MACATVVHDLALFFSELSRSRTQLGENLNVLSSSAHKVKETELVRSETATWVRGAAGAGMCACDRGMYDRKACKSAITKGSHTLSPIYPFGSARNRRPLLFSQAFAPLEFCDTILSLPSFCSGAWQAPLPLPLRRCGSLASACFPGVTRSPLQSNRPLSLQCLYKS